MRDFSLYKGKKIHMIGIGGTSMSGIADILLHMGFHITGSDMNQGTVTDRLEEQGIKVTIGHFAENVHGADVVVYSAAIKEDNPEIVEAKKLNIELVERSDFLGALTKAYEETIAISGTHGKTTTTSMISSIFIEAGKDPTIQVGADLRLLDNQNYRVGESEYFIVEACEYVRSFLKFFPKTEIVLNIEEDHLDYYKDINDIKSAFNDFLNIPGENGLLILNGDDQNCLDIAVGHKARVLTFGLQNKKANLVAENIALNERGGYSFTAKNEQTGEKLEISLSVPGYHHIYNALAAVLTAKEYGISDENIQAGLQNFTGANRRFEYVGEKNGAKIYDDYAHHPTEIKATIKAAKNIVKGNLWVAFQPHTYSRTHALFHDFVTAFEGVDHVVILDIYAAREKDTGLVRVKDLAEKINEYSHNCIYLGTLEAASKYLSKEIGEGDILLTVGAGTVTKVGRMILEE